jgi:cell division protease FtsH
LDVLARRIARRAGLGGGLMQIGKSKAKVYVETDTGVQFEDVAGVDEAKDELREIVDFLKNPASTGRLGGRMPKGVLLVGPPGTGQDAARQGGRRARPRCRSSRSRAPSSWRCSSASGRPACATCSSRPAPRRPAIIFIDELDALGRARGMGGLAGGHDEKEQTLNQLLVELDGFDSRTGLVLLAATNRPEILDPALLAPGRFDRQVLVDRPDKKGRIQILAVHMSKARLAPTSIREGRGADAGLHGADLANLVNEATLLATRRRGDAVTDGGLQQRRRAHRRRAREAQPAAQSARARDRRLPRDGPRPGRDGAAGLGPGAQGLDHPRGVGALGYTIQRPTEDRFLMTREELENKMAVLLGGRAAEASSSATSRPGAATISPAYRHRALDGHALRHVGEARPRGAREGRALVPEPNPMFEPPRERNYSDETATAIDDEVRGIVEGAFRRTLDLLGERREVLERTARRLLEKETLEEAELVSLVGSAAAPGRVAVEVAAGASHRDRVAGPL